MEIKIWSGQKKSILLTFIYLFIFAIISMKTTELHPFFKRLFRLDQSYAVAAAVAGTLIYFLCSLSRISM